MYSFLNEIFKDTDSKISCSGTCPVLAARWKNEFGFSAPYNLEYRLSYLGTIFALYQKGVIEKHDIWPLVHVMYYEKFVRDDSVEEIFFSRVDLDRKIYLKEMIKTSDNT